MEETYQQELISWRASMNESLTKENGWLALAGLFWLAEGKNSFGTAVSNNIILPPGTAPNHVGIFTLQGGEVTLNVTAENQVAVDGAISNQAVLQADTTGAPNPITINNLTMMVIQRGEQFGIRLWDNDRVERQNFNGRIWHPLQEKYRVPATYTQFATPETINLSRSQGDDFDSEMQGTIEFTLEGVPCKLFAFEQPSGELFTLFKDSTTGQTAYGAGRYLLTEKVDNGKVVIDFNRAYNPPCSVTAYATCTLPPSQNTLPVAIEAGEIYKLK